MEISARFRSWLALPPSELLSHDSDCCRIARSWFTCTDRSHANGDFSLLPPTWFAKNHRWGPSPWPVHWCQLEKLRAIDCGVFAALCLALLRARRTKVWPVQLVQQYPNHVIENWKSRWHSDGIEPTWIDGNLVYHEACALPGASNQVKIWDSTDFCWLAPHFSQSFGRIVALRIHTSELAGGPALSWAGKEVVPDVWYLGNTSITPTILHEG